MLIRCLLFAAPPLFRLRYFDATIFLIWRFFFRFFAMRLLLIFFRYFRHTLRH